MNKNREFRDYITNDILSHLDSIKTKSMFGGYGIYWHDVFIAIIADNELYTKVNKDLKEKYKALGYYPFTYQQKNKLVELNYINVPLETIENPNAIRKRLEESYLIAIQKTGKKLA
ncbi:TfoX/Sxy family protein [Aquella oligotrophica]|uniref:Competence protein TfoX n=1 Tax=Aquella oligotrophica TaxID=2067065 RepID=A0A2I7N7R2_9NEIS|nr:TfoX/Sxy family protein [Aquella oligotrophica]AUR52255.1 competence protein TfoX [Aquella oligotrophica]